MLYRDVINGFVERAREGRVCLGVHSSAMSPQLVELYGFAGLDFVIVGTEVEAMDTGRLEDLLRAGNAARTVPIVKLRRPDPVLVAETMNFGAGMVMVPHITSGPQLEEIVQASRFEPYGTRGECPVARYTGYGTLPLVESSKAANTSSSVIPIIEDKEAMNHLDEIAAVEGVDIIEIGPFDLSRSLGVPGASYTSPIVMDAIDEIVAAARKHGKAVLAPLWISPQTDSPSKVIQWQMDELISRGVTLLYGLEVVLLAEWFRNLMPLRGIRVRGEEAVEAAPATSNGKSSGRKKPSDKQPSDKQLSAKQPPSDAQPSAKANGKGKKPDDKQATVQASGKSNGKKPNDKPTVKQANDKSNAKAASAKSAAPPKLAAPPKPVKRAAPSARR